MDFIKTISLQIFQTTNPMIRIVCVAVLIAIGAGGLYMSQQQDQQKVLLFNGQEFSNEEMAAIETALGKASINQYEIVDHQIEIPQAKRSEIIKAIADSNATPKSVSGFDQSESTFMPFMTSYQQRVRNKTKKQQKICAMIREIEGIEDVLVEYDESRGEGFPRKTERTAAVTVRSAGGRHLESHEIETIRSTVRRAVAGLKPEDVVVVDGNSAIAHNWKGSQTKNKRPQSYVSAKQHYEEIWTSKIQSVLQGYPNIRINVQIDFKNQNQQIASSNQSPQAQQITPDIESQVILASATQPTSTAGSNSKASIKVPQKIESVKTMKVSLVKKSVATQQEYVPQYANVSISVPESLIRQLAAKDLAELGQVSGTHATASQPVVKRADINRCFRVIQKDITNRISPMLPGSRSINHLEQYISVSLDPEVAFTTNQSVNQIDNASLTPTAAPVTTLTTATGQKNMFNFDEQLSKNVLENIKANWSSYLIPVLMLIGLVLLKLGRSSKQQRAELQNAEQARRRAEESERHAEMLRREYEFQQMERAETKPAVDNFRRADDLDHDTPASTLKRSSSHMGEENTRPLENQSNQSYAQHSDPFYSHANDEIRAVSPSRLPGSPVKSLLNLDTGE